ncbi:MAG TPA: sigma-54 dependent transcriptional regulator [Usitatibacter sp.]|nr:sigma-54 dependent transcriptional regulator [Usitatibacter sp.]
MHVLVIDDEAAVRQIAVHAVKSAGYVVSEAANATEAASKLVRGDVDVALCDIRMPDGDGLTLLANTKSSGIDTVFIMITAFGSMQTAVEALRAGAYDYITKPVHREELLHRLSQIAAMRGLKEENRNLKRAVSDRKANVYRFTSPAMLEIDRLVGKVAPTDSTVLITGESGTGKGVTARAIHDASARATGPFVPVNCGAIPENLLESEFFGHTKGAFTGADRARKGLFLEADGGTLFLDEIGELPLHIQSKLLHAIGEKSVRAIGAEQSRPVDLRIIAATNRDLKQMVADGRFREDLFFRLSMFHIHVPSLRERQSDIRGLVQHILARGTGGKAYEMDPIAEEVLLGYAWPGNVRELENVINRASILADNHRITLADIPAEITRVTSPSPSGISIASTSEGYLRDQVRQFEAGLIQRTLEATGGDRRLAAQKLGIGLSSLYRKLEEFERLSAGNSRRDDG